MSEQQQQQQQQQMIGKTMAFKPLKSVFEAQKGVGFSLEVFPPRGDRTKFSNMLHNLAELGPSYIDVTYGAGGGSGARETTLAICEQIQSNFGIPAVAHVTCRGASETILHGVMRSAISRGICNVVALRGDAPETPQDDEKQQASPFVYAVDLVRWLREHYGDSSKLGIAVAAYPDKHPEAPTVEDDVERLREKVAAGADACVTQFFLDPARFLEFRDRVNTTGGLARGVRIIPGIIMVNSYAGFQRMVRLSGSTTTVPPAVAAELERLRNDQMEVQAFGVRLAVSMCRALFAAGERFFHIYSLNIDPTVKKLVDTLGWIAKPEFVHSMPTPSQDMPAKDNSQQQASSTTAMVIASVSQQ